MVHDSDIKKLVHMYLLGLYVSTYQTALQPAYIQWIFYLFIGTMEELLTSVSGGFGGKGGKKRRHLKKTRSKASSQFQTISFGEGK